MFVKDFKYLSQLYILRATLERPLAFPVFIRFMAHHICSNSTSSPHCTPYLISIDGITQFIFNIHQLFHTLLPDFLLIIHIYFYHLTYICKKTNPNNIFLILSLLFGNSKLLMTITTQINFLHCLPRFLIHSHIYYSLGIFFCLIIFLPVFLILTLFPNPKKQPLSTYIYIHLFLIGIHSMQG